MPIEVTVKYTPELTEYAGISNLISSAFDIDRHENVAKHIKLANDEIESIAQSAFDAGRDYERKAGARE